MKATRKIFSFNGEIRITDDENIDYIAKGKFWSWMSPWVIRDNCGKEILKIKKKFWSLNDTWHAEGRLGSFDIKRKFWSWNREYNIYGGEFNGALIKGSFWDTNFSVLYKGHTIIYAEEEYFCIRDTHSYFIEKYGKKYEDLAALLLVMVMTDKKKEKDDEDDWDDD